MIEHRLRYETTPLCPKKGGWGGGGIEYKIYCKFIHFEIFYKRMPNALLLLYVTLA